MASKVALVTGGGSGIGRAVALRLEAEGYSVAIAGRRLSALEETVAAGKGGMLALAVDVTDADAVRNMVEKTVARFGRLDVLFNNAGATAPPTPTEDLAPEVWRRVIDTNLTGAFLCAQAAYRAMKAQQPQGGRIINNGSIASETPRPNLAAYTASKHAVTGLTKQTALDCRNDLILCSQIDIGNAATPLTDRMVQGQGVLQPDGTSKQEPRMDAKAVGDAVAYMAGLPLDANVLTMTVMATKMPFVGRG